MQLFNPFDLDLNTSIIYAIIDLPNDRFYIGSSVRGAKHRLKEHLRALQKHTHANHWLQASFDSSSLLFVPFHLVNPSQSIAIEQQYLNEFFDRQIRCMNLLAKADSWLGKKHTEESKGKISKANKGRKLPAIAEANRNRVISGETREKLRKARQGKKIDSANFKGFQGHHSEKTKLHLSQYGRKNYRLCSPDGIVFVVKGLLDFCRSNCLDASALIKVGQGKQKTHKGWTCEFLD